MCVSGIRWKGRGKDAAGDPFVERAPGPGARAGGRAALAKAANHRARAKGLSAIRIQPPAQKGALVATEGSPHTPAIFFRSKLALTVPPMVPPFVCSLYSCSIFPKLNET